MTIVVLVRTMDAADPIGRTVSDLSAHTKLTFDSRDIVKLERMED